MSEEQPRWKRLLREALALGLRHFLPLCFLVAVLVAMLWPEPGIAAGAVTILGGSIHVVTSICIIVVFIISGLVLELGDLRKAWAHRLEVGYGFVAILGVTPCLGFALRALPLAPPEFSLGLAVFAAMPTTLGVGEALVRASGGNGGLALLLLVGTNMLAVATMPPWLKALLSSADGLSASVDALPVFYKLLVTVLAPAVAGKAACLLCAPLQRWARRHRRALGMTSTVMLAIIIWCTLSAAQDALVHQRFVDILAVIGCAIMQHVAYLAFNFAAVCLVLRMPLPEAIAVAVMSSQKSAPVAVTAISYITTDVAEQGLLSVPCIVGQLVQIFMGAAFAPWLARRVVRWKARQPAAAGSGAASGELAAVVPVEEEEEEDKGSGAKQAAAEVAAAGDLEAQPAAEARGELESTAKLRAGESKAVSI